MGTWEGHISPGVAFYSFGIVFCIQLSQHYFRGRKCESKRKKCVTFSQKLLHSIKNFPLDVFLKMLYGFGAAMAELFYPPGTNKLYMIDSHGRWAHLNEWSHFTMYMSFALSGLVDAVSQKWIPRRLILLEKAAIALAFYITSTLLFYHRHGKDELEKEAHEMLLLAAVVLCSVLTIEMWFPYDTRLQWIHTIVVMILGSWLFHMAFILFPRSGQWHAGDPNNEMVLPIFFCWHILGNCFFAATIFFSHYFWTLVGYLPRCTSCDPPCF